MTSERQNPFKVFVKCILKDGAKIPRYVTPESSGADLQSTRDVTIMPGKREIIGTGLILELPVGVEAQIRPRSGLALKHGITVLNSPATIDSDFRGEIKVILINHDELPYTVKKGDKIAQLVLAPIVQASFSLTDTMSETERGDGGFGHSGY